MMSSDIKSSLDLPNPPISLSFRTRGDVNNQLGFIHSLVTKYLNFKESEPLKFERYDKDSDDIKISRNVVEEELAESVRKFVQQIPFNKDIKVLDDSDNKPNDSIFQRFDTSKFEYLEESMKDKDTPADFNQWVWERYHTDIWRATPLKLSAFLNSPIFELISFLECRWQRHLLTGGRLSPLEKSVWVIQRIPQGYHIDPHDDKWEGRQISFVYYLTPDDWSKEDEGELCVITPDIGKVISISPVFNSMVSWSMPDCKSPIHWVKEVKADNSKPRICLVGFFT